jgi:hypothetical protein
LAWTAQYPFPGLTIAENASYNCVGGGKYAKTNTWGSQYINIQGCTTTVVGNTRTTIFKVQPTTAYTSPKDNVTIREMKYSVHLLAFLQLMVAGGRGKLLN